MSLSRTLGLVGVCALAMAASANGAVLAQWTFETAPPADLTNSATSGVQTADVGFGSLQGVHVSANSDWTTPSGPASTNSFSANEWGTTGDTTANYWQFSTSSAGYENLVVAFDATGSNTGPRDFKIAYSTDGSTFTDFGTYSLVNASWSALPEFVNPATAHFEFDLGAVPALDNQGTVYFRLIQNGTTSISGAAVATGGTSRVDNVTVSATLVPEPASLGLLAGATMFVAGRRRRA